MNPRQCVSLLVYGKFSMLGLGMASHMFASPSHLMFAFVFANIFAIIFTFVYAFTLTFILSITFLSLPLTFLL